MSKSSLRVARIGARTPTDIVDSWKLETGVGFLVRLVEARYDLLYQTMTDQSEITPRQFGILLVLHQCGPLTLSALAEGICCDRNTLSELVKRMTARKLISKKPNANDGRSAYVAITMQGSTALMSLAPAAKRLQDVMLAPLAPDDRAAFLECLRAVATAPLPTGII